MILEMTFIFILDFINFNLKFMTITCKNKLYGIKNRRYIEKKNIYIYKVLKVYKVCKAYIYIRI